MSRGRRGNQGSGYLSCSATWALPSPPGPWAQTSSGLIFFPFLVPCHPWFIFRELFLFLLPLPWLEAGVGVQGEHGESEEAEAGRGGISAVHLAGLWGLCSPACFDDLSSGHLWVPGILDKGTVALLISLPSQKGMSSPLEQNRK